MAGSPNPKKTGGEETGGGKKRRRLELLQFRPGSSFLHRLDPRTKLAVLLVVSVAALLFSSLPALVLAFLFVLALAGISRLEMRLLRAMTLIIPLLILVIVLDSLFSKVAGGQVYFSAQIGFLHPEVTAAGVIFAVAMGFRLLAIAGISFLFVMTTSPDDFVRGLRNMRVPATITFSLGFALRSMNVLATDTRQIIDAQRSRGLELDRGNLIRNRNKLAALFVPVTVSLLKRSKNTADAMQARGFVLSAPRSCYRALSPGRADLCMGIALAAFILVLLAIGTIVPR